MKTLLYAAVVASTTAAVFFFGCNQIEKQSDSIRTSAATHENTVYPSKPGDTVREVEATLLFVGDAMAHQAQIDRARQLCDGVGYDFSDCFSMIEEDVTDADYAVVNLETPLGGGKGGYTGYPCFSAPDGFAEALRDAGFDLFLTANNHALDRSDYGLRRTLTLLDSLHVDHTGTFYDSSNRKVKSPLIVNIKGIKTAFLNYTYGTNGLSAKDGAIVSLIENNTIIKDIQKARSSGAELVIVCIHWGVEYILKENAVQRELADFLVQQGADLIIGGHPHVLQPMKMLISKSGRDVPVVYSLGNFISNMKTTDTRGGAMAQVKIGRYTNGRAYVGDVHIRLLYAARPDMGASPGSALRNFTVIPCRMADDSIPSTQKARWLNFRDRALGIEGIGE